MKKHAPENEKEARNEDPISGAPGAHPVATGVGAVLGGLAGATLGAAAGGPVGAAAGATMAAGAIIGGLGGKYTGEAIDPTEEDAFWRNRHAREPFGSDAPYDAYAPAYRVGYEGFARHQGERFADVEADIQKDYESHKASLPWDRARSASEAAWNRAHDRHLNNADTKEIK